MLHLVLFYCKRRRRKRSKRWQPPPSRLSLLIGHAAFARGEVEMNLLAYLTLN